MCLFFVVFGVFFYCLFFNCLFNFCNYVCIHCAVLTPFPRRHFLSRYNFRILPHVQLHIKYCSKKFICFRGYNQRFLLSELVYVN